MSERWMRRNGWALALLPLVIVLALVASSSRVAMFWWGTALRERTAGVQGVPVAFVDSYSDRAGVHQRRVALTVVDIARADALPPKGFGRSAKPAPVPDGMAIWNVRLHVEAATDVVLAGCEVALVDSRGRVTRADPTAYDALSSSGRCEPEDRQGPRYAVLPSDVTNPDRGNRPAAYDVTVPVLTAADVVPRAVRVWWQPPAYLELRLRQAD